MYHILPITKLVTTLTVGVFVATALTLHFFSKNDTNELLRLTSLITLGIDFFILLFANIIWKPIWKISFIEKATFPNINGNWSGSIKFDEKEINCHAIVDQNLQTIFINLDTDTSKSKTLIAYPSKEHGNHVLYYTYECNPENPDYSTYKGTCILNIIKTKNDFIMDGHYFTSRNTKGKIVLKKDKD